jgi:hypothetical protein
MTRIRAFLLSIVAGMALSVVSATHAGTIYDNLNATTDAGDDVLAFGPLADSFSTTDATMLIDIKLKLSGDPIGGGTTFVSLLSDASTSPGSVIAQLGSISDSSLTEFPGGVHDVSGFAPIGLSANTRYWIELSSSNSYSMWDFSPDTSGTGVANEFFANQLGVFANATGEPYQMQVNTMAIPEPSTFALGIAGLGTVLAFRWRVVRQTKRQAM